MANLAREIAPRAQEITIFVKKLDTAHYATPCYGNLKQK